MLIACLHSESSVVSAQVTKKKNKGSVKYTNRAPKRPKVYEHPKWIDEGALFMDSIFDWFGYHEIPHLIRYSICLTVIFSPVYAFFFVWCCVHNDEYDDPEEEMALKQRAERIHHRKLKRLEKAAQMKWD